MPIVPFNMEGSRYLFNNFVFDFFLISYVKYDLRFDAYWFSGDKNTASATKGRVFDPSKSARETSYH